MTVYESTLTNGAWFDRSATGKVKIAGPDAVAFLHRLCTNDLTKLIVGDGCPAFLCDPRAKVQHQIWVNRLEDGLWVETVPGRGASLFQTLDRYFISEQLELTNETDAFKQYHLAGPNVLAGLEDLKPWAMRMLPDRMVRRHDRLGLPGLDVISKTQMTFDFPLGDAETYETLRIEALAPEYGKDIDDTRFVMEVRGASDAVSYAKGCFPGQEPIVMSRDRAGFVNRAFLILKVLDGGPIPHGGKLLRDGHDVGLITSSCVSPLLNQPIAIGYVKRGHQDVGTTFEANGQRLELMAGPIRSA